MDEAGREPAAFVRRDVLIAGSCFAGAALGGWASAFATPRKLPEGGLAALIPTRVGEWTLSSVEGVIVADDAAALRGPYDDLLTRVYRAEGAAPVALLVAYGGSQMDVQIHRPEICYPAAGFATGTPAIVPLRFRRSAPIPAEMILARSPLRTEQVLYWTRIGASFPTTGAAQRWAILRENLAGRVPDGVLLRVSTPGADRAQALAVFHAFLSALSAAASPVAARLLFGVAG